MTLDISKYNDIYLNYLKALINHKTVFWDDDLISNGISYVFDEINKLSDIGWIVKSDKAGNIIAHSNYHNIQSPFLYLCAHIDTVGANASEWLTDPFVSFENSSHISGRGANDCKAGVAFIMLLSNLFKSNVINYKNIGFIVTYREEGNKGKTSALIPFNELPFSNYENFVICLENTIKLNFTSGKHTLGIYQREPHNLFITITDTISNLANLLKNILLANGWKPVVITPCDFNDENNLEKEIQNEYPGHISTLDNSNNLLLREILNLDNYTKSLRIGNKNETSVVESKLKIYNEPNIMHELILNYRGYLDINQIRTALIKVNYVETFDFQNGYGANLLNQEIKKTLENKFSVESNELNIVFEDNPGRSDASSIFNNLPDYLKTIVIPFAAGPGCRSHTFEGIKRTTHGPNEGFYKPITPIVINTLLKFIETFN